MTNHSSSISSLSSAVIEGPAAILRQGRIEAAFAPFDELSTIPVHACLARVWHKEHPPTGQTPFSDHGRARDIGVFTGEFVETLLEAYARTGQFPPPHLGDLADAILARQPYRYWPRERVTDVRATGLDLARGFLERLGATDDPLGGEPPLFVLPRQHEFRLVRRGEGNRKAWTVIVRPDIVVGSAAGALVAYEFSTSQRADNVADVRAALNHWAITLERMRRPSWTSFTRILTRVEQLALSAGYSTELSHDRANDWREGVSAVAEALRTGSYARNVVPDRCLSCPSYTACQPGVTGDDVAFDSRISSLWELQRATGESEHADGLPDRTATGGFEWD